MELGAVRIADDRRSIANLKTLRICYVMRLRLEIVGDSDLASVLPTPL